MAGQAFGVIGLEVMGRNIALNIERNGFPIAVYNRTYAKTEDFINRLAKGKQAIVKGTPQKGQPTTDTYALAGFAQALAMIDKACGIKR